MRWMVLVFSGGIKGPVVYVSITAPTHNPQDFGVLYIDGLATLYPTYDAFLTQRFAVEVNNVTIVGPYTMQQFKGQESA